MLRLVATAALLSTGCDASALSWEVTFGAGVGADDAALVEATIRRGGCGGDVEYTTTVARGSADGPAPPELDDGSWGFAARAIDDRCRVIAEGCVEVTVPTDDPVTVELRPIPPTAACPGEACDDGVCGGGEDAGVRPDARSCTATEANCADGSDDDCDGATDCGDSDCSSVPACETCTGVDCPECEICVDGACTEAPTGEACPDGECLQGSCCAGCIDGSECVPPGGTGGCDPGPLPCAMSNECRECETCQLGFCEPTPDLDPCSGGRCVGGVCCTGCVDGGTCVDPVDPLRCGADGGDCVLCPTCQDCNAANGSCVPGTLGTLCVEMTGLGRCDANLTCCSQGCISSSGLCSTGRQPTQCGMGGDDCGVCDASEECCTAGFSIGGTCAMMGACP